jgi:hypothetical protein
MFRSSNAIAALWRNAYVLNISCAAPSIFVPKPNTKLPPSLLQTALQTTVVHLPYIDVLPFPAMRSRIISALAIIDEDDLRRDLMDSGLRCWGRSPWDPRDWELQDEFTDKWWFLLDEEIVNLTNWWRSERGDDPLVWKGSKNPPRIFELL